MIFLLFIENKGMTMADANEAWSRLDDEKKAEYNHSALLANKNKPGFHDMPVDWQKQKIASTRKKITDLVTLARYLFLIFPTTFILGNSMHFCS